MTLLRCRLFPLWQEMDGRRILIFCETKKGCDAVTRQLRMDGWPALSIHGDKSQVRMRARDWFGTGGVIGWGWGGQARLAGQELVHLRNFWLARDWLCLGLGLVRDVSWSEALAFWPGTCAGLRPECALDGPALCKYTAPLLTLHRSPGPPPPLLQHERDWVLAEFKTGKHPIMIATDVAARGLGASLHAVAGEERPACPTGPARPSLARPIRRRRALLAVLPPCTPFCSLLRACMPQTVRFVRLPVLCAHACPALPPRITAAVGAGEVPLRGGGQAGEVGWDAGWQRLCGKRWACREAAVLYGLVGRR